MRVNFEKNWIVAIATRFIFCVFITPLTIFTAEAQKITGRVQDSKTLEALPFANVFLNNTTIGTVTDINGEFALSIIKQPSSNELVFSFVGYESHRIKVNASGEVLNLGIIRLVPSELQLNNVEISSKRDKEWERKLKRFKKVFLGKDKQAAGCLITNPWVIDFPSSNPGEFVARANAPIEINNNALGYTVVFYLTNFWSKDNGYLIAGDVRFTSMTSKDSKEVAKWQLNRRNSYLHSSHHLFRSIIENRTKEEGFSLYREAKGFENATYRSNSFYSELGKTIIPYDTNRIVMSDVQKGYFKIFLKGHVEVHYSRERAVVPLYSDVSGPVSWIDLRNDYVVVNREGYPKNPEDVVVSGDMSMNRVARMLPLDYEPDQQIQKEEVTDLSFYREQIYVHTDKPYYYPGETIWFKGYVNYHFPAWRDSLSHTVYVELIDRKDRAIVQSKTVRIDSGFFYNDFILSDSLKEGNYYLRAYTNLNRVFGDRNLYIKLIPILNLKDRVDSEKAVLNISVPDKPNGNQFLIESQKDVFAPREEIKLNFYLKDDEDQPSASNFSISVIDVTQVAPLESSNTIISDYPMKELDVNHFKRDARFFIEHGVNFSGRFTVDDDRPIQTMLDVFQLDQPNFAMAQTNSIGIFSVNGLSFYDTAQFYIRPSSSKSQVGKIEILKRKSANIEFDDLNYSLNIVRTELPQRINSQNELIKGARLLKEVEVKAKRIIVEKPTDRVQRPYGRADYILKRKDLNLTYGNLLQTLPGKVPGLIVRQVNNPGNDAGPEWVVYISKGGNSSSFINVAQVLITINDVVVTGNPGQILSAIDPNTVESIEVKTGVNVLYGSLGGNGVVSIYTKMGFEEEEAVSERKNIPKLKVAGYAGVRKFNHPIYSNPETDKTITDYRSTIYWNPNVSTKSNTGVASISFFAADLPGKYQVVAEGVTQKGEPIRCVYFIEVRDDIK